MYFRTASNLSDAVNINKYPLGKIKELLGEKVDSEMNIIFDKLQRIRSTVSAQNLDGLSMLKLQSLLSASYSSASGAKSKMITRMLSRTEQGKLTIIRGEERYACVCYHFPLIIK